MAVITFWLFIAHLVHPLVYAFWDSPEDKEMERQMLEWCRKKFPEKYALSTTTSKKTAG